eukprot:CAMPEP_0176334222 /NCGR_PEP_ID=MMETSP0121_2-20121125/77994_1 /TAXON_ID=160619 /ORGANISM="Kryptoperidinium foliaceum, Strain CCMP 1326" /LENGTH=47 /DNA_ID= /DNA_START= /DNA_END= /DNA_ORIENTATION=
MPTAAARKVEATRSGEEARIWRFPPKVAKPSNTAQGRLEVRREASST